MVGCPHLLVVYRRAIYSSPQHDRNVIYLLFVLYRLFVDCREFTLSTPQKLR